MSKRVRAKKSATVEEIMSRKVVSVDADASAQKAAEIMAKKNVSSVMLKDGDRIVGILTERDLARNVCAKDGLASKTPAVSIMSTPVQAVSKNAPVGRAASMMAEHRLRHLAVEGDYQEIIGVVTTTDLARYLRKKLGVTGADLEIVEALYA
ncbi:MAG: CBS domain-containing protein [Nitrososphaera sp.]|uniref:CBS domain-containing protein n=1 Tax=Nitrososphaera sp. TaxID=1971748 RepID=UPI0017E711B2|nr:CBS domain-containing protein [Nitrososphaera sp.]NWG36407.1 CBS domain-containing protein [Nitrososphaera sp.]